MRNWWTIAKLELTLSLRDREAVLWSLIAPVAMAAISTFSNHTCSSAGTLYQ